MLQLSASRAMTVELEQIPGNDTLFWIIAADRKEPCPRYVGAQNGGCSLPVKLYTQEDRDGSIRWRVRLLSSGNNTNPAPVPGGPAPAPILTPSPQPVPPQPSQGTASPSPQVIFAPVGQDAAPAPVIHAESIASGALSIRVSSQGGDESCSVQLLTFVVGTSGHTSANITVPATTALMQGVQIPVDRSGYYYVYAFGICEGTEQTTLWSQGLTVYNQMQSGGWVSAVYPTVFSVRYTGFSPETFTQEDENQVCQNVVSLQPGGKCIIVLVSPGSAVVTGNVVYGNQLASQDLTSQLNSGNPTVLSDLVAGLSQSSNASVVVAGTQETNPTPDSLPPSNVQALGSFDSCPGFVSANVSWELPAPVDGVLGYSISCLGSAGNRNGTSVVIGATVDSATVRDLAENVEYTCSVSSLGTFNASVPVLSSSFVTGCASFVET